jgi:hypothetical protein
MDDTSVLHLKRYVEAAQKILRVRLGSDPNDLFSAEVPDEAELMSLAEYTNVHRGRLRPA